MANTYHDQLSGSDLHANKIDATTGTELTAPSQVLYDSRWIRQTCTISTTAPLTGGGSLATDRTISLPPASASQNGYLSSVDWATFNVKQPSLGYTPVNRAGDTMTGSLIAALFDHGGQVFSVRAYGAAGDGTTDDTNTIKATITAMGSGGILFFPPGTYKVASSIDLPSNISVVGCGTASTLASSATGDQHPGIFNVPNKANIAIERLRFVTTGNLTAITSYGHQNLTIRNNYFTGTSNNVFSGMLAFDGQTGYGLASMTNTLIEGNTFYDIPNTFRTIHIYPRSGHLVENMRIIGNHFEKTSGPAVMLNNYDISRGVIVANNTFLDIQGGSLYYNPGIAVYGGIAVADMVYGTIVSNNYYRNTLSDTANPQEGFCWLYSAHDTVIADNIAIGAWTTTQNNIGPALAPGRTTTPMVGLTITGNFFRGFDAGWDPNAMVQADVSNNVIHSCGRGLDFGYQIQKHVRIHHNTLYNCGGTVALGNAGFVLMNASSAVKCEISDNLVIDDRATPVMTKCFYLTGHVDFSDLLIINNRFYCPSGTLNFMVKQYGDEITPRRIEGNEMHDSTGVATEFPYAQGNLTGATTLNRVNGAIITATLTGNTTVTLTAGTIKGQILELRLTQDATGSRIATWPSNFKKAGGSLVLSAGANSLDMIIVRWDGSAWVEVSRALNDAPMSSPPGRAIFRQGRQT